MISGLLVAEKDMQVLKDIVPAAFNNINTKFIVLDKGRSSSSADTQQQKTCLALVADETASVHFQMWADECDQFEPGDIITLSNGIFSYANIAPHRNILVLRAGRRGRAEKVGEFTMSFVETPNLSEIHWVPDPSNPKVYVQDRVISPYSRIFPPAH
ncbi:hypothetical protein DM860_018287 [Cuscuta australis]|uniref:OB domain-containing protein n=2 Tax=Cuscuta sect. Cleistogrammica TaxID=1824901 RepID=A0A328E5U2_9ASTE|nr:hypothetical protein DM860_018284 [Cuscuta australis]RAL51979.1 hypothetical protein DM860_018287 [Cuscuta australis]